ncbi:MAG: hypothetical protein KDI01_08570 [Halioglobus sp.]|nr:hypothetical protein [Halioglobus sp.]
MTRRAAALTLTGLSLLLGALALTLAGYFASGGAGDAATAPQQWTPHSSLVPLGSAQPIEGGTRIVLDHQGRAVIALPAAGIELASYPYLRVAFGDAPAPPLSRLLVRAVRGAIGHWLARSEDVAPRDTWFYLGAAPQWRGKLVRVELFLLGVPGQTVTIHTIGLYPRSASHALQSLLSAWSSAGPWRQSSVNQHTGGRLDGSLLYPLPAAALLAAFALTACALAPRLFPGFKGLRWPAAGGIVLFCWLLLDALWQWQLLQRLHTAREQFASGSNTEKLLAGPDRELFAISRAVKQALAGKPARVLVSAREEYRGMRLAYYLYPLNVFWERGGPPLPDPALLRAGDYILLLQPSDIGLDRSAGLLRLPDRRTVPVKPVLMADTGVLVQVL